MTHVTYKIVEHDGGWAYTVNGVSQTKAITREVFTNPGTICM